MHSHRDHLRRLTELVARLRAPDGCPWDREQSLEDVRSYLLEEAHELAAAIDGGDWRRVGSELGDLLFQAAFVARLGEEAEAFRLAQVVEEVERKMISRHPHVFGGDRLADSDEVRKAWERRKLEHQRDGESLLSGVPDSLPSLLAAFRMTQKAAAVGFDWPDPWSVLAKLDEELRELREELDQAGRPADRPAVTEEIGDLLFTLVNLARRLGVDPDAALAAANRKFRERFRRIEQGLAARGQSLAEASLEEMETLWQEIKRRERE